MRFLFFIAASLLLSACDQATTTENTDNTSDTNTSITVSLIQLNDLHAHLTPHTDYIKKDNEWVLSEAGGLARLSTLINTIRLDNPHSILMNIGDTYHGGVEALFSKGNAIVDPVNALNIDIGVPGNWDFAFGPDVSRARYTDNIDTLDLDIKKPNFINLAANVTYTFPPAKAGQTFLPATHIKTINGIRIGFIGLTSDIVPRMHESLAMGLDFLHQESDYLDLIHNHSQALRDQGAHMVVVMSELGIHKDWKLAKQLSANTVDVIFSAHTHEATFKPLVTNNNIWVVEAGSDIYLGRLDVRFENGQLIEKNWQLLTADTTIEEDPVIKQLIETARAPYLDPDVNLNAEYGDVIQTLSNPINTVIGQVESGFDRRHALNNIFNRSFTATVKNTTGTELAITPGFRFDAVIADTNHYYEDLAIVAGQFTIEDAYRFFPVAFTLSTAEISGERLKEIIEENLTAVFSADIFKQNGGWLDGFGGIDITLDLAATDGARIIDIVRHDNGQSVSDNDVFSVTGCTRPFDEADILCSYSGFSNITPFINTATGSAWTAIDFLIDSIENNTHLGHRHSVITDISATTYWPQQDFYQPVEGVQ